MNSINFGKKFFYFFLYILLISLSAHAGNIDPDDAGDKYAWGENTGWINLAPSSGPGVTVSDSAVTGYAWGENVGWISMNPENGGVLNDGSGNLSGYAWGENTGWISFSCKDSDTCGTVSYGVVVDPCSGTFSGYAWSENMGWISFYSDSDMSFKIVTSWRLDSDSDGTPDCNDECMSDPDKTEPGTCGCGTPDVDTDSDGTLDCNDECASDPDKTEPGTCGCGTPDVDTDSDGTLDCNDECPSDPGKTSPGVCGCGITETDTDSDGTPDCIDNDDDNDGLSDEAEEENGTDPQNPDTDGDGASDGDEVESGSDPLSEDPGPGIPVLVFPENGAVDVILPVKLEADYSESASADLHGTTRWQISRNEGFSDPVMDIISENCLLELTVPDLVLESETDFYWRVRFEDISGLSGMWSETGTFTTAEDNLGDENGNGIPDDQEPGDDVSIDIVPDTGEGWSETLQYFNVTDEDGTEEPAALQLYDDSTSIEYFSHTPSSSFSEMDDCPGDLVMGLFTIRLKTEEAATFARIYFSSPLPEETTHFYKYDTVNGWIDYSGYINISDDMTYITIELVDGGFGDADGVVNGVIVDPLGPLIYTGDDNNVSDSSGGGCFIDTLESNRWTGVTWFMFLMVGITAFVLLFKKKDE